MSTFTLAISCLTTFNLLWFMDLTFQIPMQCCSLQHRTLLLSPVTSTVGCCFSFGSISSFFLELFLHWSPAAYWAPTDLGNSSFSVLSFCLFILFTGFSRQEYWSGLPVPSPVGHSLSELSTVTRPSWVTRHGSSVHRVRQGCGPCDQIDWFSVIVVFSQSALWWRRIRGLWELPDGRDWLRGKLGLVLMGRAMLSKALIPFSVEGRGWVPSLLFTWAQTMVEVMKIMGASFKRSHAGTATLTAPNPAAGRHRPTPQLEMWTLPGKSGSVSCGVTAPFSWVLVLTRFCLCLSRVYFPVLCEFWQLCGGVNSDLLQESLCHTQVCCTQSPWPWGSPLPACPSTGDAQTQFCLSLCGVPGA